MSKRILVFSDSHGDISAMERAIRGASKCDMIFHLGDYDSDARALASEFSIPVYSVAGNCDYGSAEMDEAEVMVCGKRLILCHGHKYGVKHGYDRVFYHAKECGASAILFGHTHKQYCEYEDGVWLINPGSIGCGKGGYCVLMAETYGVIPKLLNAGFSM